MRFLILAAVIWGSSFPVITYALRDISPFLFLFLRFFLAFVILFPRRNMAEELRLLFRRDLFLIAIPNALSFIIQFKAQELTTASKTALFLNSSPVWVVVFSWIFFRTRFSRHQVVAMLLALSGVVVTSTRLNFADIAAVNTGDLLAISVGVCWGFFIVFSEKVVKRYGAFSLARGLIFWTAVLTVPFLATESVRFAWISVIPIVYLSIFTTVLAYTFYLRGVRSVSPLATSIIILVEVVVAFGIAHFALGESFSAIETMGVLMVIGGVVMVLRKQTSRSTARRLGE